MANASECIASYLWGNSHAMLIDALNLGCSLYAMSSRPRKLIVYKDTMQEAWHQLLHVFWNVLDAQVDFNELPAHVKQVGTQARLSRVWNKIEIFNFGNLMAQKILLLDLDMLAVSKNFDNIWLYMDGADKNKMFAAVQRGVYDWPDNQIRPMDTLKNKKMDGVVASMEGSSSSMCSLGSMPIL